MDNPMMNQTLTEAQFLAIKEYIKTRLDERDFHDALPSDDRLKEYISWFRCDPTNKNHLENVVGLIYYRLEPMYHRLESMYDRYREWKHKNTESE